MSRAPVSTGLATLDEDQLLLRFPPLRRHDTLRMVELSTLNPGDVVRDAVIKAIGQGDIAPGDPDVAIAVRMGIVLQPLTFMLDGRIPVPAAAFDISLVAARPRATASRC